MRGRLSSRWARGAVVATMLFVGGGAALAYYSAAGTGSASATAATAEAVTIAPGTPTAQLYPGGTGDVVATISNPNTFDVRVNSLELDKSSPHTTGFDVDSGHPDCNNPDLSFDPQNNGGQGWTVPANATSYPVTLTDALTMGEDADNGCQGATFTVYLQTGP